ncbi:MAG: type II toxin-antitoxin system prevent-host-death family antitoxin [Alphaproteobacteria bacterium]|nr:type II toxin-antitoxin system prevent-host-death family antitoxin [Alphaproteobacteria bacterium]MBU6471021.1 type II toxin-antitoxin system prevent-host-death family antitoxin [Alphaproteobacteria bacterium]MDE2012213.1 type II toxin-antitoxin system prevent-host-death family antitoxin [Alphaproteobacteria bacterium]MDE2074858.1 type II toxin-antitoxin system prevent-host-death family antitoxin [Alphaproteobacteria bacterium]MDE2351484.1 type II toxin-antitoxin system prevent-host-death fa
MTEKFVDINDAKQMFPTLAEQAASGHAVVITRDGKPVARLGPIEPSHRAKETRYGVKMAAEFEPEDTRVDRLSRESEVPHRLRELPRH